MLSVEITSMPASSSSSTSCQRFSLPRARDVGVRELVDEGDLGPAGEDRVDVHLLERRAAVVDAAARDDLEVAELLGGLRAAVGLDDSRRRRRCRARRAGDPRRASRTSCRRRARRRGRCGACRVPCVEALTLSRRVEREVQLEHVHARLAEEPERASVGVLVDEVEHLRRASRPRASATRGAWMRALAGEMCGSRPEPEAVTASTGTSGVRRRDRSPPVRRRRRSSTSSRRSGFVGPRFDAELDGASYPSPAADGRGLEVLGVGEGLADQARADDGAVALDERAVGLVGEGDLRDPGDDERVGDADEHGERDEGERAAGASWRRISTTPERARR